MEFDPPRFAATFRAGCQVDSSQLFEPLGEAFLGLLRWRDRTKQAAAGRKILAFGAIGQ